MQETLPQRRRRWSRAHSIWLLMILSLVPGAIIAVEREIWIGLPAGVRAAIYLISAALIATACWLILRGGERDSQS